MTKLAIYNGKTGGLGQYLEHYLISNGYRVVSIETRLEDFNSLVSELDSKISNIGQIDEICIFHLAAIVNIKKCNSDPAIAYNINVYSSIETIKILTGWALRYVKKLKLIYTSSCHVYKKSNTSISESHPIEPRSVYADTKYELEKMLIKLASDYGFVLLIARVFGLVSPRQKEGYMLPGIVKRVLNDDYIDIPGLYNMRDYLDARDVARLLVRLSSKVENIEVVNICSGKGIRIIDIMKMVIEITGKSFPLTVTEAIRDSSDIPCIIGNNSKLKNLLGSSESIQSIKMIETIRDFISETNIK